MTEQTTTEPAAPDAGRDAIDAMLAELAPAYETLVDHRDGLLILVRAIALGDRGEPVGAEQGRRWALGLLLAAVAEPRRGRLVERLAAAGDAHTAEWSEHTATRLDQVAEAAVDDVIESLFAAFEAGATP